MDKPAKRSDQLLASITKAKSKTIVDTAGDAGSEEDEDEDEEERSPHQPSKFELSELIHNSTDVDEEDEPPAEVIVCDAMMAGACEESVYVEQQSYRQSVINGHIPLNDTPFPHHRKAGGRETRGRTEEGRLFPSSPTYPTLPNVNDLDYAHSNETKVVSFERACLEVSELLCCYEC